MASLALERRLGTTDEGRLTFKVDILGLSIGKEVQEEHGKKKWKLREESSIVNQTVQDMIDTCTRSRREDKLSRSTKNCGSATRDLQ